MSIRFPLLGSLFAMALVACTTSNSLYCDEETPCADPELSFCDLEAHECIEPPAGACVSDEACESAGNPICDVDSRQCRGCVDSDECAARNPDAPICAADGACVAACEGFEDCDDPFAPICAEDGLCAACDLDTRGDADCAARDAQAPYCLEEGECAACRDDSHCTADAPVCDADEHVCRPCEEGAECQSGVCDVEAGECIAESQVVYVEDGGNGSSCTKAAPCGTIQDGVDAADSGRPFILVTAGSYTESVTVDDRAFTMLADGVELSSDSAGDPVLRVLDGSDITIEGLRLHGATDDGGHGLRCDPGGSPAITLRRVRIDDNSRRGITSEACDLRLFDTTVTGNQGAGISAENGSLSVERSSITDNEGGGINIDSADFVLRNNFIVDNAGGTVGGVAISGDPPGGASAAAFEFNTVVGNDASLQASGLFCLVSESLTFSNNIIYGNEGDQVDGENCGFAFSNIQDGPTDDGNIDADPLFVDPDEGDYRLQSGSPCIDAADPDADIETDFFGTERPQGDGFDIGAHELET